MKIFNFEIKEDRNWYIVNEWWKHKDNKPYIVDTTYPATLEKALLKIAHRKNKSVERTKEIYELIDTFKKDRDEFLTELRKAIRWQK